MVERGKHDGPPTHAVTFVWNGHEVTDQSVIAFLQLSGQFTFRFFKGTRRLHLHCYLVRLIIITSYGWSFLSDPSVLTFQGEDVTLVGDFTGNWKEPLKAVHRGGLRHEVEVKLPQGKYVCYFHHDSFCGCQNLSFFFCLA